MAPNLALFLAIFFILVVFMIESRAKANVSLALWVPLIWYALVASRNVSFWFNGGGFNSTGVDYASGSPIDRMVFSVLIVIGMLILYRRKVDWVQIIKSNAWIFILFLYMGLSIFWSDFPFVSFKRWIRTAGTLVMVLVVLTDYNPLEAISTLLRRCFLMHIPLSIVCIKYFQNIGVSWDWDGRSSWIGVAGSKNVLGQVAMTCGVYSAWNIMRTWRNKKIFIDLLLLLMALWVLKGSRGAYSATSLALFFLGIIILFFFHHFRSKPEYLGKYMAMGIFLSLFFFLALQFSIEMVSQRPLIRTAIEATGRDITLTDRTYVWSDLLDIASDHPILGVGYGSFWIGNLAHHLWEKYAWHPGQGHNGYIDVYVELGLVGVFLLISVIFFAYKNIMKSLTSNFEYGKFRIVFLSMTILNNVTESTLLKGYHNLWFLFLLVAVHYPHISQFQNSITYQSNGK